MAEAKIGDLITWEDAINPEYGIVTSIEPNSYGGKMHWCKEWFRDTNLTWRVSGSGWVGDAVVVKTAEELAKEASSGASSEASKAATISELASELVSLQKRVAEVKQQMLAMLEGV